jgi:hypothetical protein
MGPSAAALMLFDGDHPPTLQILSLSQPLYFCVADLQAEKNTVSILHDLRQALPEPTDAVTADFHNHLYLSLNLCLNAVNAIETGNTLLLGQMMNKFQSSFNHRAAPLCSELQAPRLRAVLSDATLCKLCVGGKGVGSQGDGSVQWLCDSAAKQSAAIDQLQRLGCIAFSLTLLPSSSSKIQNNVPSSLFFSQYRYFTCIQFVL